MCCPGLRRRHQGHSDPGGGELVGALGGVGHPGRHGPRMRRCFQLHVTDAPRGLSWEAAFSQGRGSGGDRPGLPRLGLPRASP